VNELELNLATSKSSSKRAQSLDVRVGRARPSSKGGSSGTALPEIGGGSSNSGTRVRGSEEGALPSLGNNAGQISFSAA
jgi:hypothetical protein